MQTNLFGELEEQQEKGLKIVAGGQKNLSKNQQMFNRLIQRIETLEKDIVNEHDKLNRLLEYYSKEVAPLETKIASARIKLAMNLGNATKREKFSKRQIDDIRDAIVDLFREAFVSVEPNEEQEKFYDQWSEHTYREEMEEQEHEARVQFSEIINDIYGFDIDPDKFGETPEDFARLEDELKNRLLEDQGNNPPKERKKSKKQQEKESSLREEESVKIRSLRSIYIALAKVLHPDTETDETLKLEKEEIMKNVTAAYDQRDLPALLKLEIAWVHKTAEHLVKLTDEKLAIYIQALKKQASELETSKNMLYQQQRFESISAYSDLPEKRAMEKIIRARAEIKGAHEELKSLGKAFERPNIKKQMLEFVEVYNDMNEGLYY